MLANREGRFRASVCEKGVNETGPNKLCTVVLRFRLNEEHVDGQWRDVSAENLEVVAYCYVEKRDGTLNDFQIQMLREAFGWTGMDPFWFEDTPELPDVQVTLEWETYNQKQRIRVRWINAYDAEPSAGVTHADANQRRSLTARLGSRLRAHFGGTPAPAPKPTGAPKAPPKRTPPPESKPAHTMDATWVLFADWAKAARVAEELLHDMWFDAIREVCGHDDADRVTPEQWAVIQTKVPENPF